MKHLESAFKGNNHWLWYVLMLAIVVIGNFVGSLPLAIMMGIQMATGSVNSEMISQNPQNLAAYNLDQNVSFGLMLLSFVGGLVGMLIFHKLIHKRSISELINGTNNIRWSRMFFSFVLWLIIGVVGFVIYLNALPDLFVYQFDIEKFIPLLVLSLLLLPLQTTMEEFLCRGYLAQAFGLLFKNRILTILLPSVIFAGLHYFNPEVKEFGIGIAMTFYLSFGIIFGLISVLDDGIELAMGAHAANNISIALLLTHEASALQVPAVYRQVEFHMEIDLIVFFISAVLFVAILWKKYQWNISSLFQKIEKPNEE